MTQHHPDRHVLWCEGLAPGTWVKAWLGGPGFRVECSACEVQLLRPIRVVYFSASEARDADSLAALLRAYGYVNVNCVNGRKL